MVTDDFGNQVKLDHYPERIVSLVPSNTEILLLLAWVKRLWVLLPIVITLRSAKDKPKIMILQEM